MEEEMRVKIIFLCLLAILFIGNDIAFGSVQSEEVITTSRGRTPDEAVINCLDEAIIYPWVIVFHKGVFYISSKFYKMLKYIL